MSLWTDGLEPVPRTGSATRPEAAGDFVTSGANEVLDFSNRLRSARSSTCSNAPMARTRSSSTAWRRMGETSNCAVSLVRTWTRTRTRRSLARYASPRWRRRAPSRPSVSVRLKSECRQHAVSSDPVVDVLQVADLPVGSPDVPRLETVVVPFPVVHTPPPHVFFRDVKFLKEAEAKKIGKLVGYALSYFLPILGMLVLSGSRLTVPANAILRGPMLTFLTILSKFGIGPNPYEFFREKAKADKADAEEQKANWGITAMAGMLYSALVSSAVPTEKLRNIVKAMDPTRQRTGRIDATPEEATLSFWESFLTFFRMTNAAELISKIPTDDLTVLTREPDPSQTGKEQREQQLNAVVNVSEKLSKLIVAPISETRTPAALQVYDSTDLKGVEDNFAVLGHTHREPTG